VVPLGIGARNPILIERLLQIEMSAVPPAAHGSRVGDRRGSGHDEDREAGPPRRVERASIVLRTDIHMSRCGGRPTGHRRISQCGIEPGIFVGHRDQLGRGAAMRLRLGDRLLEKHDLRAGDEEQVITPPNAIAATMASPASSAATRVQWRGAGFGACMRVPGKMYKYCYY
jgi:hypothetical protein